LDDLRGGTKQNDRARLTATAPTATSSKRGRSSKATRGLILEAALAEFAEHGYQGATTASIARRVGVTQPLVHYHFGSKEALWRTTVDGLFTKLTGHLRRVSDGVGAAHAS
jgi:AcrR family transcriptional regulator